jgi:GPH family glycoside/pentoside/hexuronide:cation symporter
MSPPSQDRLPLAVMLAYALPGAGTSFLFALMLVGYLNYGTEVLGVSASALGLLFFAARVWDGVADPLVGYGSDKTRGRLGRRKSWMLAACPVLWAAAVAAWAPPRTLEGGALLAWISVSVLLFHTCSTVFDVPHMALGAELTQHRRDRVRVFGMRQLLRMLGLFAAFGLGASLLEDLATARERLGWLAIASGGITAAMIVAAVAVLPRERADYSGRGARNPLGAARDVWRNRDARTLLFVFGLQQLGMGAIGVLVPFVVRHVLRMPDLIAEMLIAYTLPALLSVPLWMWLGERFEKRTLWLYAMGASAFGFGLLLFLDAGRVGLMLAASIVAGAASGCAPTLGQALKADVIDRDELETGERKEGAYFAAWMLVDKIAAGVVVGAVGIALDLSGFVAGQDEQSQRVVDTMVFLTGGLPVIGLVAGMIVFRRFALTQHEHARVLAALAERRATTPTAAAPR